MRILFINHTFPGLFSSLAAAFGAESRHEVLFASSYGRRQEVTLPGVRKIRLSPHALRARTAAEELDNMMTAGRQALHSFEILRESGFVPDMVLSSSRGGYALFWGAAFPDSFRVCWTESCTSLPDAEAATDPFFARHLVLCRQVMDCDLVVALSAGQPGYLQDRLKHAVELPYAVNTRQFAPGNFEALEQDGLLERSWSVAGPDAQAANEASDPCSLQKACQDIPDITRDPLELPCNRPEDRPLRLQMLARSDEGFLLAMAYSTQRGFGAVHPFTSELRRGFVEVSLIPEELDFPVVLGELELTECITVSRYTGTACEPCFTQGYGLAFGNNERKAISMSIVDRALRAHEMEEEETGPGQNPEFVLLHGDSVDASGFVQHIKLPHYVDFQAELSLIRELRGRKKEHKETDPDETNAETGNGTGTVPGNGEDAR